MRKDSLYVLASNGMLVHLMLAIYIISAPAMSFSEPIALYRLFNHSNDHLYTTSCQGILDGPNNKYGVEGITGYIESTQLEGTVPLSQLWKPSDHFYTADVNERNALLAAGYRDEGIVGYIRPIGTPDTTPLYRSFNAKSGDHFYTTSKQEHDKAISQHGYKDEGITGYIWTSGKNCPATSPPSSSQRCVCFFGGQNSTVLYQGACNSMTCQLKCHDKYQNQYQSAVCQSFP